MDHNAVNSETPKQTATDGNPEKSPSILENALVLWQELYGFSHDCFHLIALEARRAGKNLVYMLIAGLIAAVLLIGAWLGIVAAAVLWLIEHGFMASSAILLAVALTLLLTLILIVVIHRKSRYLQFPATVRSLQPMPSSPGHNKEEP
ncbi:MAG: phage holin family protein [Methylobacter sp.]